MKICNNISELLPSTGQNAQTGFHVKEDCFARCLNGMLEDKPSGTNLPVNLAGIAPAAPSSNGSGDRRIVAEKACPPVNPVGIRPLEQYLNGSGDRRIVVEKACPPVTPIGIRPLVQP